MRPERSSPAERDVALDAPIEEPAGAFEVRPQDIYRTPYALRFDRPAPAQYVVPSRFGMSGIIGIVTALAVLFGMFHIYNAHPALYLFFGAQAIVICVAQMFYGKTPRAASAISGAVFLPLFLGIGMALVDRRRSAGAIDMCALLAAVPTGAFVGYVTGTLAAGVFLVMDSAERLIVGSEK